MGRIIKICQIRNEHFAFWGGLFVGFLSLLVTCFFTYIVMQIGDVKAESGLESGVFFPWEDPARMLVVVHTYVMDDSKVASAVLPGLVVNLLTRFFFLPSEFPHLSGFWLYALWLLEALILVIWAGAASKSAAGRSDYVFCETCQQETKVLFNSPLLNLIPIKDLQWMQRFRSELEGGNFAQLENLSVAAGKISDDDYSKIVLRGCDHCEDFYCADVVSVAVTWDGYDLEQASNQNTRVIEHLMLPAVWYQRLRVHFEASECPTQPVDTDAPRDGGKLVFFVVGTIVVMAVGAVTLFS